MGSVRLRENARAFVASLNGDGAKIAKENAAMKEEIAELKRQMDEDRELSKALLAKLNLPDIDKPGDMATLSEAPEPKPTRRKAA